MDSSTSQLPMASENVADTGKAGGKSLRLLRPSIVVLCGPAACGKSTFAQRHFRPTQIVSSDWARAHVCDDERDQRFNTQAFALVHFLVEQRLMANRLCVVDSTALTPQARKELLDLARKYQVPSTLLLFNVALETCVQRDQNRQRSVGRAIIERHYRAFEETKAALGQEGFDQVVEIPGEASDQVQIEILFRPVARPAQRPDAGPPRRFERSAQPSRPHPNRLGDNRHPISTALPGARPGAAPRPAITPGSIPKVAAPRPGEAPVPGAGTQPPSAAPPPASPEVSSKPSPPSAAGVAPKPESDKSP